MLITDYLVGRDESDQCVGLLVHDAIPLECEAGRCHLVRKVNRHDLVQEFVQDGTPIDWLYFPDLPKDVVELLERGDTLTITDAADDTTVRCIIEPVQQPGLAGVAESSVAFVVMESATRQRSVKRGAL